MTDNSTTILAEPEAGEGRATKLFAFGGIAGAIAASSCCVLPLVLFSLGISGAWIGELTALSPYQPIFMSASALFVGFGYWRVRRNAKLACADGAACTRSLPNLVVNSALWIAVALITLNLAWPYLAPLILA